MFLCFTCTFTLWAYICTITKEHRTSFHHTWRSSPSYVHIGLAMSVSFSYHWTLPSRWSSVLVNHFSEFPRGFLCTCGFPEGNHLHLCILGGQDAIFKLPCKVLWLMGRSLRSIPSVVTWNEKRSEVWLSHLIWVFFSCEKKIQTLWGIVCVAHIQH